MPIGEPLKSGEAAYIGQLALGALCGILLALILAVALHVLSRELNPITRAMSDYVHGRHGWLMLGAFGGLGVGLFALAEAFRHVALSAQEYAGGMLLGLAGAAAVVTGVFPIDNTPDGRFTTARGAVHAAAGYALSPLLVGAMLCLSAPWNRPGDSDLLQPIALGFATVNAVAFGMLLLVNSIRLPIGGIGQRVFMVLVCVWLVLTSIRLLTLAGAGY